MARCNDRHHRNLLAVVAIGTGRCATEGDRRAHGARGVLHLTPQVGVVGLPMVVHIVTD